MDTRIKNRYKTIGLILLFILCVFIALFASACKKGESSADENEPKKVEVATPMIDSVVIFTDYPANLVSESQADAVARVNGKILSRHFEEGSYVKKGDLLFVIDTSNYESSVRQAKAQLESALSQLEYASKHYDALREAFAVDAVSQMEVEQAKSSKLQAEASVKSAKAALDAQTLKLSYCRVTAPISGKITAAFFDAGAYVAGEGSPVKLATIYDDNNLTVNFSIPEMEYAAINSEGEGFKSSLFKQIPVEISSSPDNDGIPQTYYAELVYSSPNVETSTGSIPLKAKIKDASDRLLAGMYSKVKLPVSSVKDGILIRDASISTDQRGKYIYTLNDSNKVVYTPIEIGDLYHDSLRLVKSGITPQTRYVTRSMMNVRAGEKVVPVLKK